MKKPNRPTPIDKAKAMAAAARPPQIQDHDLANLLVAARRGLAGLAGGDLVLVATSIANVEAVLAAMQAQQQKPAQNPAPAADPAKEEAKP